MEASSTAIRSDESYNVLKTESPVDHGNIQALKRVFRRFPPGSKEVTLRVDIRTLPIQGPPDKPDPISLVVENLDEADKFEALQKIVNVLLAGRPDFQIQEIRPPSVWEDEYGIIRHFGGIITVVNDKSSGRNINFSPGPLASRNQYNNPISFELARIHATPVPVVR